MRPRSVSVAAGTALLSLFLLGSPADAGEGAVVLFEGDEVAETYVSPEAGECHELPYVDEPRLLNATQGTIELYADGACEGDARGELGPGEAGELRRVFSFSAVD